MKWLNSKKSKSRKSSPHRGPVPATIPSHIDTALPNIPINPTPAVIFSEGKLPSVDIETNDVVLTISAGENDAGGSHGVVLRDSRSHEDDVTRGTVDKGSVERNGDQGTPSNIPDRKHFVPNAPSLSTEGGSGAPNRRGLDKQELQRGDHPASKQVSSYHTGCNPPDPVQSDSSERKCQQPGNALNPLTFSSCGGDLGG